jgi:RHS repeat-associated protein
MSRVEFGCTVILSYQADYEPYGSIFALRGTNNPHQPLRLPGQVAEQFDTGANGATDLSYNNARWYRPTWGRYAESDPFGIVSSPRLYSFAHVHKLTQVHALKTFDSASTALSSYGSNSPGTRVDPTGLFDFKVWGNYCGPAYTAALNIPTDALNYDQWRSLADNVPPFDALDQCCEDHGLSPYN